MYAVDVLMAKGATGVHYPFAVYGCDTVFPAIGAVHMTPRSDRLNRYAVTCDGQTGDLGTRFYAHYKQPGSGWRCCVRTHLAVLPEEEESCRRSTEFGPTAACCAEPEV